MTDKFELGRSETVEKISAGCEYFAFVVDIVYDICASHHIDPSLTSKLAEEIAIQSAKTFGGENIYIPKKPKAIIRQVEIFKALRESGDAKEVARRFGVTEQWVYNINRRIRKEIKTRTQPDLF